MSFKLQIVITIHVQHKSKLRKFQVVLSNNDNNNRKLYIYKINLNTMVYVIVIYRVIVFLVLHVPIISNAVGRIAMAIPGHDELPLDLCLVLCPS